MRKSEFEKILNAGLEKELARREKISSSMKKKSKFKKTEVFIPMTKEKYDSFQKNIRARTSYTDNPIEIADQLIAQKEKMLLELKDMKHNEGLSIGYNFKFKFDETKYEKNIISQRGFTSRRLIGKNGITPRDLDLIFDKITERFDDYMSRQFCLGVKLDSLIIEKTPTQTYKRESNRPTSKQRSVTKKTTKKKKKVVRRTKKNSRK